MSSRNTIQEELRSFGSGLPVTNNPSFSVPEGYFEELAATILAKVKSSDTSAGAELSELSPLLAGIPKAMPYSVPSSYFEDNLQNALTIESESEVSFLTDLDKAMPYEVPTGYFDELPAQILAKVSLPKAKVVPLFARTWMRAASAAVVAGVLFFGGWQLFNGRESHSGTAARATETSTYVAQAKPVIQEIKKASTKDLEEFIGSVPPTTASAKKQPSSKEETKELLKDVSVNEMENFLSTVPQNDDELAATDQP